jgi:hypothetical protein
LVFVFDQNASALSFAINGWIQELLDSPVCKPQVFQVSTLSVIKTTLGAIAL